VNKEKELAKRNIAKRGVKKPPGFRPGKDSWKNLGGSFLALLSQVLTIGGECEAIVDVLEEIENEKRLQMKMEDLLKAYKDQVERLQKLVDDMKKEVEAAQKLNIAKQQLEAEQEAERSKRASKGGAP